MALTAYCMKTKQKNVPFNGKPMIEKTSKGGYCVKGEDKAGNKMAAIVSETTATEAIKKGEAVKGWK